jgi:hypothetical protein
MILSRRSIEFILAADVERSKAAFNSAKAQARELIGNLALRNTFQSAMDAYGFALNEFNAFITSGDVPLRLRESNTRLAKSARARA